MPFTENTCSWNDTVGMATMMNTLTAKINNNEDSNNGQLFCEKGTKVHLIFDETSPKSFKIYLTQAEIITIYVHLMWFNSIVLFVVIVVLCYAVLLKRRKEETM